LYGLTSGWLLVSAVVAEQANSSWNGGVVKRYRFAICRGIHRASPSFTIGPLDDFPLQKKLSKQQNGPEIGTPDDGLKYTLPARYGVTPVVDGRPLARNGVLVDL